MYVCVLWRRYQLRRHAMCLASNPTSHINQHQGCNLAIANGAQSCLLVQRIMQEAIAHDKYILIQVIYVYTEFWNSRYT